MSYETRILEHFERALLRGKTTFALYGPTRNITPAALDVSDLLRSAIVLSISALDYLIHAIIRLEIEDRIFHGRSITGITVPIEFASYSRQDLIKNSGLHIKNLNSFKSFVSPAKMADGLKCILDNPWEDISSAFEGRSEDIKRRLTLVVDLRNRIAHEGDLDHETIAPQSYDIRQEDVEESINFIERLGRAVVEAVVSRQSEMAMKDFAYRATFPVNLRASRKGTPAGSFTVHRLPNGCRHAIGHPQNKSWFEAKRWSNVRSLARSKSLGCCKHCWSDDAVARTSELQNLNALRTRLIRPTV